MKKCHKKTCETASSKKSIITQLQLWTIVVIPIDITNNRDTIYGSANTNLFFLQLQREFGYFQTSLANRSNCFMSQIGRI